VPRPQPADHQHGAEVFEQQGHADRHPGHRVEVEQLASGYANQAEGAHPRRGPAQHRPVAAQLQQRRDREYETGQGDPGQHRRRRAPPGADQRRGERPGRPERRGGQDAEGQARAAPPDPATIRSTSTSTSTSSTTHTCSTGTVALGWAGHGVGPGGSHGVTPGMIGAEG
jgi:hypothetical protein